LLRLNEVRNKNIAKGSILIGDSKTDYEAAKYNNITFIARGDYDMKFHGRKPKYILNNFNGI